MNVLEEAEKLGMWFVVNGDSVKASFKGPMSTEAKEFLQSNKQEIKALVLGRESRLRQYTAKAIDQLKEKGIIYVWSSILQEEVAFVSNGHSGRVKPGTVSYSVAELEGLKNANFEDWKHIHLCKKTFGGVIVGDLG